jgi:lysophospholipase L1-like esterase
MTFWLWLLTAACVLALLGEVAFRILIRLRGIPFSPPKTYRHFYIVPHPYLPYVYKPHTLIGNVQPAPYPLHRGRYEFRPVRINNIRFFNEDVRLQKEPGTWRVMCLGGSTTANSIWAVADPQEYSYPLCLRAALAQRAGSSRYEVLNCGMGGWTSAEIFINFALHLIDLRPDIIVLYHGFNDLEASLTTPFASDYSHSRRNFGETYARIRLASYLPNLRFWKSYAFLKGKLVGFGNVRYDLLSSIRAKKADLDNSFMGLETERRNIEHLIHLCRANHFQVILSTFAYHIYAQVEQDRRVLKYHNGVQMENVMLRELAERHQLPLVDLATLIPDDDAYFVDTVHFTPLGMRFVADCFADRIIELEKSRSLGSLKVREEAPA